MESKVQKVGLKTKFQALIKADYLVLTLERSVQVKVQTSGHCVELGAWICHHCPWRKQKDYI